MDALEYIKFSDQSWLAWHGIDMEEERTAAAASNGGSIIVTQIVNREFVSEGNNPNVAKSEPDTTVTKI